MLFLWYQVPFTFSRPPRVDYGIRKRPVSDDDAALALILSWWQFGD